MNILYLFDVHRLPSNDDFSSLIDHSDAWADERDVMNALRRLGHRVEPFGILDDIRPLINRLEDRKFDLVFATVESFKGSRTAASHVIGVLELMNLPYTGATPLAMELCRDKGLSKKILKHHQVAVPNFKVVAVGRSISQRANLAFPAIVKPLGLEASEGISQSSLVHNSKDCQDRIKFIHHKFGVDAIVEQFIDGREIYVAMTGNHRPKAFTPIELVATKLPEDRPMIATYKAKWDHKYRQKWGYATRPVTDLPPHLLQKIDRTAKKIYRLFNLSGYARLDLRLDKAQGLYFLEANPNPALNRNDEFAMAVQTSGLPYEELIASIIKLGLNRSR